MLTYTGIHVTREFGAPSIQDIAVQTMRLCRFCGAVKIWWPVGMHLLLVADMLPAELKVYGYLHDGPEACTNDTPQPLKTDEARKVEDGVEHRMYTLLGIEPPTAEQKKIIKAADIRAVNIEGFICGPRGFQETQRNWKYDEGAHKLLQEYLQGYNPADTINADGQWVRTLERRIRESIRDYHARQKEATVAAQK